MPEFGLCRHFVARIRDPYIGAKCYINVMLCYAMLFSLSDHTNWPPQPMQTFSAFLAASAASGLFSWFTLVSFVSSLVPSVSIL